jgi:hypothetical protein
MLIMQICQPISTRPTNRARFVARPASLATEKHALRMGHVLITCVSLTSRSLGILQNESFVAFRLFLNLENQPSRRLRPRALRKSRQEFARD